jgi:hypothetical protein
MAKRKRTGKGRRGSQPTENVAPPSAVIDEAISYSDLSLHQLFDQQSRALLDRSDLSEEQKQNILVAMSCPCCGAGAMSYTAKLKR